jgi:lysyl-tRNA synthetase class 2
MMELYQAFADYTEMIEITEALITTAAIDALDTTVVDIGGEPSTSPTRGARHG